MLMYLQKLDCVILVPDAFEKKKKRNVNWYEINLYAMESAAQAKRKALMK